MASLGSNLVMVDSLAVRRVVVVVALVVVVYPPCLAR